MTQAELAVEVGVQPRAVAEWEDDVHRPRKAKLEALDQTFGRLDAYTASGIERSAFIAAASRPGHGGLGTRRAGRLGRLLRQVIPGSVIGRILEGVLIAVVGGLILAAIVAEDPPNEPPAPTATLTARGPATKGVLPVASIPVPTSSSFATPTPAATTVVAAGGLDDARVKGADGLCGQYYDDPELVEFKFLRRDANIQHDWRNTSPHLTIGHDYFSIRWTGYVKIDRSETYTFHMRSDDGVRLWVGDHLIIDYWGPNAEERSGRIALSAGKWYPIKIEYQELGDIAYVVLDYSSPSLSRQVVPTDHLRTDGAGQCR
ncbi:MAG: PA14 domain-containing protein [Actinomycetota bacterium]|nr:PA14 domain-containing protein [Actinomycetota bacterium]